MADADVLDVSRLSAGLFVENLGPTVVGDPDLTVVGVGYPALGFNCDDQGRYSGLGVLSAAEFEMRRSRLLNGRPPTD